MIRTKRRRGVFAAAFALWLVAVIVGFTYVVEYEFTSGPLGGVTKVPAGAVDDLDVELPTLFLFVHPKCPCTRATLEELNRIMASCQGRLIARVLFYKPAGAPDGWEATDLWQAATEIPGVSAHVDVDGKMSLLFGASVSGHAMLYSPTGELLFTGGITVSRGHAGDNFGKQAIIDLVLSGVAEWDRMPVFGCSIRGTEGE